MAFFHGVRGREVPTSIIAPAQTTAGLPVVFGTAPVHLTDNPSAYVNKPVICYSWAEAVDAFQYNTPKLEGNSTQEMMSIPVQFQNSVPHHI